MISYDNWLTKGFCDIEDLEDEEESEPP